MREIRLLDQVFDGENKLPLPTAAGTSIESVLSLVDRVLLDNAAAGSTSHSTFISLEDLIQYHNLIKRLVLGSSAVVATTTVQANQQQEEYPLSDFSQSQLHELFQAENLNVPDAVGTEEKVGPNNNAGDQANNDSQDANKGGRNMEAEFKKLRGAVTCSICFELLAQPCLLTCSHSFCGPCLQKWIYEKSNKSANTNPAGPSTTSIPISLSTVNVGCPNCRKPITTPPILNLLAKEQVEAVATSRDLARLKEIESKWDPKVVWKEFFPTHEEGAVIDYSDGVTRCGTCSWEVLDGKCSYCGRVYFESEPIHGHDESMEELDEEMEEEHNDNTDEEIEYEYPNADMFLDNEAGIASEEEEEEEDDELPNPRRRRRLKRRDQDCHSGAEESSDSDWDKDDSSFVCGDDEIDYETQLPHSEIDGSDHEGQYRGLTQALIANRRKAGLSVDDIEEMDPMDFMSHIKNIRNGGRRRGNGRGRRLVITSEDDGMEEESGDLVTAEGQVSGGEEMDEEDRLIEQTLQNVHSPAPPSTTKQPEEEDKAEESESDSDGSDIFEISPAQRSQSPSSQSQTSPPTSSQPRHQEHPITIVTSSPTISKKKRKRAEPEDGFETPSERDSDDDKPLIRQYSGINNQPKQKSKQNAPTGNSNAVGTSSNPIQIETSSAVPSSEKKKKKKKKKNKEKKHRDGEGSSSNATSSKDQENANGEQENKDKGKEKEKHKKPRHKKRKAEVAASSV